ncbi:hypothetical protein BYT27DRAFT_7183887 [Phlegmacium glaucopus]|nr:hypothetical protein BYT27DRAFT_7183887 [Phlegmacium glaucopus]
MDHLLSSKPVNDQPLTNPNYLLEGSQSPSSYGVFFTNANGLSINQSTFNVVHGNMNVSSREQPSHWNKYQWVDFDQQTLRRLHTSSTGIVTMEMEPMTLTSRVKTYRIHWYGDRKDIFYNHLEYAKSPLARRPDIPQFFGTSIDNEDSDRFIVLSGGGLSLSNAFIGSHADLEIIKIASFFQLLDIFSTSPFTVLLWDWSRLWDLPIFSSTCGLLVDVILLESYGLLASSKGGSKRNIENFYARLQLRILPGDMERMLHFRPDMVILRETVIESSEMARRTKPTSGIEELSDDIMHVDSNATSGIEEFSDVMHVDSCFFSNNSTSRIEETNDGASYNSKSGIQELSDDEMHVDSCSIKELFNVGSSERRSKDLDH